MTSFKVWGRFYDGARNSGHVNSVREKLNDKRNLNCPHRKQAFMCVLNAIINPSPRDWSENNMKCCRTNRRRMICLIYLIYPWATLSFRIWGQCRNPSIKTVSNVNQSHCVCDPDLYCTSDKHMTLKGSYTLWFSAVSDNRWQSWENHGDGPKLVVLCCTETGSRIALVMVLRPKSVYDKILTVRNLGWSSYSVTAAAIYVHNLTTKNAVWNDVLIRGTLKMTNHNSKW